MVQAETAAGDVDTLASSDDTASQEDLASMLSDAVDEVGKAITGTVVATAEKVKDALGNFLDAFAIMLVTSCVIPLLVLVFFLWLVKMIFGINVNLPLRRPHMPGVGRKKGIPGPEVV